MSEENQNPLHTDLPDTGQQPSQNGVKLIGFWATALATLGIVVLFSAVNILAVVLCKEAGVRGNPLKLYAMIFGVNAGVVPVAALIWLITRHRGGCANYLKLNKLSLRNILSCLGYFILFYLFMIAFGKVFNIEPIPQWQKDIFSNLSAWQLPALLTAAIIAAPLWEEIVFRGFAYAGFAKSFLQPIGAILLTSLAWTLMHGQYELSHLTQVFLFGCFIGILRWRYNSLTPCLLVHCLNNAIACLVTLYEVNA